jgi:hypothetical protein
MQPLVQRDAEAVVIESEAKAPPTPPGRSAFGGKGKYQGVAEKDGLVPNCRR